jgi:hypothetical protein
LLSRLVERRALLPSCPLARVCERPRIFEKTRLGSTPRTPAITNSFKMPTREMFGQSHVSLLAYLEQSSFVFREVIDLNHTCAVPLVGKMPLLPKILKNGRSKCCERFTDSGIWIVVQKTI